MCEGPLSVDCIVLKLLKLLSCVIPQRIFIGLRSFLIFGLLIGLILAHVKVVAQSNDYPVFISGEFQKVQFPKFVESIQKDIDIRIFYRADDVNEIVVDEVFRKTRLDEALIQLFQGCGLDVFIDEFNDVFIGKEDPFKVEIPEIMFAQEEARKDSSQISLAEKKYLTGIKKRPPIKRKIGNQTNSSPNTEVYISGRIRNSDTGESLIGVTIYLEESLKGTITNDMGYFRLPVSTGRHLIKISSIGMKSELFDVEVWESGRLDVELDEELVSLTEVVVEAKRYHNVRGTQMGLQRLEVKDIKEIPRLMGELDIIAVAKMLPGVKSVGEGSGGFNVRGSSADQNLFYINSIPFYNTSHLFGFFSAFNPEIVGGMKLFKSNMPVNYGGRLASFTDINAREGNRNEFALRGGVSPVSVRLSTEGPLFKNKGSYLFGGRSTYSDWTLKKVDDPEIKNSGAGFYDLSGNFNYDLDENNRFGLFSIYTSDRFNFSTKQSYRYQNFGTSINWEHLFSERFNNTLTAAVSSYNNENSETETETGSYNRNYLINHYELKSNFNYNASADHQLNFGGSGIYYDLDRGAKVPLGQESLVRTEFFGEEQAIESAIFVSDEWTVAPRFTLYAGLRYSLFMNFGKNEVRDYVPGKPSHDSYALGTSTYSSGELIKSYSGPEWRLSGNFSLMKNHSVKLSLNRLQQYIFMLTNTVALSPTDQWKLSDKHITPQIGDQISIGYYMNSNSGKYELSLEGYLKQVKDKVEYRNGADLIGNRWIETDIVQGDQEAYGVEFMLRKKQGVVSGWLSYAYSRSFITVANNLDALSINDGNSFPSNYDIPHAVNFVGNYRLGRRVSLSTSMVYNTGRPITYPSTLYYINGIEVVNYSNRNEYRIPDYFRVDFSVNIEGSLLSNKFVHSSWVFNVYNATGRKNAYSVFFKNEGDGIVGYKKSIFGVPIFTLTWNFKLGDYSEL